MDAKILKAKDNSLINNIIESLQWAHTANFGVAYASSYAYQIFKTDIELFLRRNGKIRVLFDIEKFITDQKLIDSFAHLAGDCECKIFLKPHTIKGIGSYHPKFYLFYNDKKYNAIVGSSNFTIGGVKNNYETNLSIAGEKDEFFELLLKHYQELWQLEFAINVLENKELLIEYQQLKDKYQSEETKSEKRLKTLQTKISKKVDKIVQEKKLPLNENFAYLLGLICANGEFDEQKLQLKINLKRQIANKNQDYEGYYFNPEISDYKIAQLEAHQRDLELISERLIDLMIPYQNQDEIDFDNVKKLHFQIIITFHENSLLLKEIKKYHLSSVINRVPAEILNSKDNKIIKSFLRGYCDLKSRVSSTDGIYNKKMIDNFRTFNALRVGISVSHSHPQLMKDLIVLFEKIDIQKGLTYSNPEKRTRELLIRIDVRRFPLDLLGTHWRRIFINDFRFYLQNKNKKYNPKTQENQD
jgi:HKD family nuclease